MKVLALFAPSIVLAIWAVLTWLGVSGKAFTVVGLVLLAVSSVAHAITNWSVYHHVR